MSSPDKGKVLASAKSVIKQEIKGLEELLNSLGNDFYDAVDALHNAKGRIVLSGMGKSGHIANKLTATLASTGSPAIFLHPSEAAHGDLGMITHADVVVLLSNSGNSLELDCIIEYCKRFEIPIVGISRKADSALIKAADITLVLPATPEASNVMAPTTSTTMMLALGDAMAVALHEIRGFTEDDFKTLHPGGKLGTKLLKVHDLMHTEEQLPTVFADTKMTDVILEISKKRLGCTAIIDKDGKMLGIITDGDLRRNINRDFRDLAAQEIMTKSPVIISPEQLASRALSIMEKHDITCIFVLEKKSLVGIIHVHDLLKAGVV